MKSIYLQIQRSQQTQRQEECIKLHLGTWQLVKTIDEVKIVTIEEAIYFVQKNKHKDNSISHGKQYKPE